MTPAGVLASTSIAAVGSETPMHETVIDPFEPPMGNTPREKMSRETRRRLGGAVLALLGPVGAVIALILYGMSLVDLVR